MTVLGKRCSVWMVLSLVLLVLCSPFLPLAERQEEYRASATVQFHSATRTVPAKVPFYSQTMSSPLTYSAIVLFPGALLFIFFFCRLLRHPAVYLLKKRMILQPVKFTSKFL